jgi:hypothetical protein
MDPNPIPPPPVQPQSVAPVSTPASPVPIAPVKKPRSNLLVIIRFIVVVLLLGIGIGIFFPVSNIHLPNLSFLNPSPTPTPTPTPTPDPTADWKTYTNSKYNYLFKYPTNFSVETKGDSDITTTNVIVLADDCKYDAGDRCLTETIDANMLIYNANKTLSDYIAYASGQARQTISEQSLTIDGKPALAREIFDPNEYSGSSEKGVVHYITVMVNDQTVFNFDFVERGKDQKLITSIKDWQKQTYIDQILSTFTFLGTTATPSAAPTSSLPASPSAY